MAQDKMLVIDPKSGFCSSNSIFYSKRDPLRLPANESLDITTFISSYPHHGHIAYIDAHTGQHLTFSEVWCAVDSVSTSLYNLGIRKGHVVLILSPNSVFFPIVCHSVMSLGAIITTTNPMNTPNELRLQIMDSNPVLAFTTQPLLSKLETATDQIPIILITDHDHGKGVNNKRVVSTLHEMMAKKPNDIRVKERVNQDDTACLLYSSGTTGNSKGVASSHKNLIVLVQNILTSVNVLPGKQTIIDTVPMFHIYGFGCFVIGWLASEFTIVVLSRFDLDAMLSAVSRYRVTHLPVAPPVINTMINKADEIKSRWDLSSLHTVVSGGASLSKEGIEGFLGHYPTVQLLQGYAMTESNGFGASMDTVDESKRFGSVGRLSASLEAKIIDPVTGDAFGVNRTGELWIRGPSIMKGYLNNSEATAATIDANGWLKTGDLCYIDEDGFLYVVDRLKELIKYKGYQVPPAELESLLLTHPQIADAAVIPYPDVEAGQVPMAYIVRQNDADLQESTIKEFVAEQVAPYKRIRHVKFITAIPKNPSGKILRKDLINLATSKL